jgi:hypothetical protein
MRGVLRAAPAESADAYAWVLGVLGAWGVREFGDIASLYLSTPAPAVLIQLSACTFLYNVCAFVPAQVAASTRAASRGGLGLTGLTG